MAMTLVQTITVGSGGSSSITFSNIPQTGVDLMVVMALRDTSTTAGNDLEIRVNGSSTTYSFRSLWGSGSNVGRAGAGSSGFLAVFSSQPNNATSNTFSNIQAYISNYKNVERKSASIDAVTENNSSLAYHTINGGLWTTSAAITSLSISLTGQTLQQNSTASLYIIS